VVLAVMTAAVLSNSLMARQASRTPQQAVDALLAAVARGAATRHSLGREGFAVIRGGMLRFERVGKRPAKLHRRAN